MTQIDPNSPQADGGKTSTEDTNSAAHAETNGTAPNADATPAAGQSEVMKRAAALADRLALQFGVVSTVVTEGFKRFASRVREEAEDLWAEAQHLRKGKKP